MTYVTDASVLVSALTDDGEDGRWALDVLGTAPLAAPHLALVEATNILRRLELASELSREMAALAHASLLDLPIELYPYPPFARSGSGVCGPPSRPTMLGMLPSPRTSRRNWQPWTRGWPAPLAQPVDLCCHRRSATTARADPILRWGAGIDDVFEP